MGTRSLIGQKLESGEVRAIYCHWDGYPSYNGVILRESYGDPQKIQKLLELGDLSTLGHEIGEKHDFNQTKKDWCKSYGRDRGEENVDSVVYENVNKFFSQSSKSGAEYLYLFQEGKWICYDVYKNLQEVDLYSGSLEES